MSEFDAEVWPKTSQKSISPEVGTKLSPKKMHSVRSTIMRANNYFIPQIYVCTEMHCPMGELCVECFILYLKRVSHEVVGGMAQYHGIL